MKPSLAVGCKAVHFPTLPHLSVNSFLAATVFGQHIAFTAPTDQRELTACLRHYSQQKQHDPEHTALCVSLAPDRVQSLKRWLPRAVHVHTFDDGHELWCDPPEPSLKCGAAQHQQPGQPVMAFAASVNGVRASVLLDTGASRSFVSNALVQRHRWQVTPVRRTVTLADGTRAPITATCTLSLKIQSFRTQVTVFVMDLAPRFDIVLGDDWLTANGAEMSFKDRVCMVHKAGRRLRLYPHEHSALGVISGSQVRRALRNNRYWKRIATRVGSPDSMRDPFLVHVRMEPTAAKPPEGEKPPPKPWSPTEPLELPPHLTPQERVVLEAHKSVFNEDTDNRPLPDFEAGEHVIELEPGHKPPFRPMYRYSPAELEEIEKTVAKMLKAGWIEPTVSPYGAPLLFVPKPDGTWRCCVDYRSLNRITVKNRYPLPRIDQLLDALNGATVFTGLDLQSGYHLLSIRPEDVPKTAFRVPCVGPYGGSYAFKVLPMGLTNAPATFQNAMNRIFKEHLGRFVLVYLDDVLVFSRTREEHAHHLRVVFGLLERYRLYCRLRKCTFAQKEVKFLGHIVGAGGVKVDPAKIATVAEWPVPANVSEVRSFLGLATYFRKFVQGFSTLVRPLTNLTKATVPWEWTPACQEAYEGVKYALTHAPVLALPDFRKPFEVICDASITGLGAVLLQEGRPVAFESRRLIPAEVNYLTTEQELLAVVHALQTWRCYLEGVEFTVVTDHNPLTFLPTQPTLSRRQARWAEFLSRFRFKWEYRPGRKNVADPLSRIPLHKDDAHACVAYLCAVELRPRRRAGAAQEAPEPQPQPRPQRQTRAKRQPRAASAPPTRRQPQEPLPQPWPLPPVIGPWTGDLRVLRDAYERDPWFAKAVNLVDLHRGEGGLWYKGDRLVIPDEQWIKEGILYELPDAPYSGHVGMRKTLKAVERLYWWPGITQDVERYVRSCHSCQRAKAVQKKQAGLLQPLPIPEDPFESISMDWITGLPPTERGHDAVLVFVCRLTKMVHLCPTTSKVTAEGTARLFHQEVFKHHGLPRDIVSDRDPRLTSHFWRQVMSYLGTKLNMSTAFHPQTDGQTERVNRVLEDMLRHFVGPHQNNWDELLPTVEFAINNSYHESTKDTPFRLVYGRDPRTPLSLGHPPKVQKAHEWADRMMLGLAQAKKALAAAQQRQKAYADAKRRPVTYQVGQEVLLNTATLQFKGPHSKKLLPRWVGPFVITKLVGPAACELDLPDYMPIHPVFHVSKLRPFVASARQQAPPPPIETASGDLEFFVERVLDHRVRKVGKRHVTEYLVRWLGYGAEADSWEPEGGAEGLADTEALEAYKQFAGLP